MQIEPMRVTNGIAWHRFGIRVEVQKVTGKVKERVLMIDDINPQNRIVQMLSRWDCFRLGLLIAWRSIWAYTPLEASERERAHAD